MARRRPPRQRWHVGDSCLTPYEVRPVGSWPGRTYWSRGQVVAVRGDRVVVAHYRWESVHPWWALRVPPKPRGNCRWRVNTGLRADPRLGTG